jgi:hypothetical protein
MTVDSAQLARQFFAAARALAMHRGTLQDRLADAYADHLLAVSVHDLPTDLQDPFRELEDRLNREIDDEGDDPIAQSASRLSDAEAQSLIERILLLYARVAAITGEHRVAS